MVGRWETRPGPTGVAGPGLAQLRSPHAPAGRWAFQDGYAWRRHGYVCGNASGSSHALPQSVSWRIARRFALGKSSAVTTRELETLAETVSRLAASRSRCDRSRRSVWRAWRDDLVGRFHRTMKPAVRPYAGKVLVGIAASLLADLERAWRWADELDELTDAAGRRTGGSAVAARQTRARAAGNGQADGGVGARTGAGARQPGPPAGRHLAGAAGAEDHRRVGHPARDLAPDGDRGPGPRLAHRRAGAGQTA